MNLQEQERETREAIAVSLESLAGVDLDALERRTLGEELNFGAGRYDAERIVELFRKLRAAGVNDLPLSALNAIQQQIGNAASIFKDIGEFTLAQNPADALQRRNKLLTRLERTANEMFAPLALYIAWGARPSAVVEAELERARSASAAAQSIAEKAQKSGEQLSAIVEAARLASGQTGVSRHGENFSRQAAEHLSASRWWLAWMIMVSLVGVGAGVYAVSYATSHQGPVLAGQLVQVAIGKLAILSIIYFAIVGASRSYRAHRHNYTLNRHRQNALLTFEAFVKGASDEQTKNAVLLQATSSIFAQQATGYLEDQTDKTPPQIIDIFAAMTKAKE